MFAVLYSHPLVSVRVVELHVVARLNPADGPRLFTGYRWDENSGRGSKVRRPVAQDHAGRLVDAGGVGVDGTVHLQDDNTVSETLGLTSDALDAAHCIKWQHKAQQGPEFWREERCMKTARGEGSQRDPRHVLPKFTQNRSGETHASLIQSCFHDGEFKKKPKITRAFRCVKLHQRRAGVLLDGCFQAVKLRTCQQDRDLQGSMHPLEQEGERKRSKLKSSSIIHQRGLLLHLDAALAFVWISVVNPATIRWLKAQCPAGDKSHQKQNKRKKMLQVQAGKYDSSIQESLKPQTPKPAGYVNIYTCAD